MSTDPSTLAELLEAEGIRDERVLDAVRLVPRHLFVSERHEDYAYENEAIPLSGGQSTSQPFILARMLELADVRPGDRVLEIGSGCGYLTALLVSLGATVSAIELSPKLAATARETLAHLDFDADLRAGDGRAGWPDASPFDRIISGVACEAIPTAWLEQLSDGGRIVAPVGRVHQRLTTAVRRGETHTESHDLPVSFATMRL